MFSKIGHAREEVDRNSGRSRKEVGWRWRILCKAERYNVRRKTMNFFWKLSLENEHERALLLGDEHDI